MKMLLLFIAVFAALVLVLRNPLRNLTSATMAVPKKRRSKAKGNVRLSLWKRKAREVATKAYSEAKKALLKKEVEASKKKAD